MYFIGHFVLRLYIASVSIQLIAAIRNKPFWISMRQEMMGLKWHQTDHMQIIKLHLAPDSKPYFITQFIDRMLCLMSNQQY